MFTALQAHVLLQKLPEIFKTRTITVMNLINKKLQHYKNAIFIKIMKT